MALDIVFISYGEPDAEENWEHLRKRFPYALRVDGVAGIPEAFIEAARISKTSHVWTIDADNIIKDTFDFSYEPEYDDRNFVHLWYSENAVNGLEYGYGGLKLWPRRFLKEAHVEKHSVDFTIPASHGGDGQLKIWPEVASITYFNTSAYHSYRAGFREGAKLIAEVLNEGDSWYRKDAEKRLKIWATIGEDKPFGKECIEGALDGETFGAYFFSIPSKLAQINSFEFIKEMFKQRYG